MTERKKYLWYTDTHLDLLYPFNIKRIIKKIKKENPEGVFLTGDISKGKYVEKHLERLAKELSCDIFFVLGNHDYHGRSIQSVHDDIRRLDKRFNNLYWMTESEVVSLTSEVAVIGAEGWYDTHYGDPKWIKYTTDRWLTLDFLGNSFSEQLQMFTDMAEASAELIKTNLNKALEKHKVVYILTHFPPWKEATRDEGTLMEEFWLPYNTNYSMGKAIEEVMRGRKKKKVIVLAGHTHEEAWITVSRNIECRVNKASYSGWPRNKEKIFV